MTAFEWIVVIGAITISILPPAWDPAVRALDWLARKKRRS